MRVDVRSLDDARDELARLCDDTDQLIYPRPSFLDFLEGATRASTNIITASEAGQLVGALPFMTLQQPGYGMVINSLPWWGSHGGCIVDRSDTRAGSITGALLEQFQKEAAHPNVLSATMILSHREQKQIDAYNAVLRASASDHRIGQITQLPAGGEAALAALFTQKTRNLVRKSLKQGFGEQIRDDDQAWDFLHRTHTANIKALNGKPKPREHFEALRRTLPADMRRLSLAMDGETPVAALLLLYGGSTVEYVTPATDVSARSRQPLSFLIWHGMLDAIARGFRNWNWGGTWVGQQSLHHFKAGFGAEDHLYSYLVIAGPAGPEPLRARLTDLGTLFPYFYTYPYAALDGPA